MLFGTPDLRDSKPVAFFTGLGSKPVRKATGLSLWLLHRLVHYWQTRHLALALHLSTCQGELGASGEVQGGTEQIIKKEQGEIKKEPEEETSEEVYPQEEEYLREEEEMSGRRVKREPESP